MKTIKVAHSRVSGSKIVTDAEAEEIGRRARAIARKPSLEKALKKAERDNTRLAVLLKEAQERDEMQAHRLEIAARDMQAAETNAKQFAELREREQKRREQAEAMLKQEREDSNALRVQLFNVEQDRMRLRGYLQALEDAKPPVMVPANTNPPLWRAEYMSVQGGFSAEQALNGYGRQTPKQWFER